MNGNYQVLYISNCAWICFLEYVVRVLVPVKCYFYFLFVHGRILHFLFEPVGSYVNCKEF